MSGQSRIGSLAESCANIGSGYVLSLAVWTAIAPLYGIEATMTQNASICAIFTAVSIVRSYCWRRAFNWWHVRRIDVRVR